MIKNIKKWLIGLMLKETSPHKIALSSAVGMYIAFSPFMGFHTVMAFAFAWAFSLNISIVLAVSMLINNPVSMVPVYGTGYVFGVWVVKGLGFDLMGGNPAWLSSLNTWIAESIGHGSISLYAFLCGGNILGVVGALITYPLIKYYAQIVQRPETANISGAHMIRPIIQQILFRPAVMSSFEDPVYAQAATQSEKKQLFLRKTPMIVGRKNGNVKGIQR